MSAWTVRNRCILTWALAALVAPAGPGLAAERAIPADDTRAGRIVVEGGWVRPFGDLADDFNATPFGFGAGDGLELGFRWRFGLSSRLSLAPSFHFINHRDLQGDNAVVTDYRIESSTYRYGIEVMLGQLAARPGAHPFLAAGVCLNRNRFVGYGKDFMDPADESFSVPGLSLRAGLQWAGLEWSLVYNLNRFSSWRLFALDDEADYDWSTLTVRLGWALPLPRSGVGTG